MTTNPPNFIFKVGPIAESYGSVNAYFVYPGREDAFTFLAEDDRSALSDIVAAYKGNFFECEDSLAPSAAEFGIAIGELTPERAHILGLTTFDMVLDDYFQNVQREGIIFQFGMAASAFWAASPWQYSYSQMPLIISFQGSVTASLESIVMGAGGFEYGLAMYPEQGAVARVQQLYQAGHNQEAAGISSLGLTFEAEPQFAVDGMLKAYQLPRIPIPLKVVNGERVLVDDLDLLALSAALQSVSALTENTQAATGSVSVTDLRVDAIAETTPTKSD